MIKFVRISAMVLALCFEKIPFWIMSIPLAGAAELTVQKQTDVIPDAQSVKELTKKTAAAQNVVDAKNNDVHMVIGPTVTIGPPDIYPFVKDHSNMNHGASFPTFKYSYISGNNEQVSISSGKKNLMISWTPARNLPPVNSKPGDGIHFTDPPTLSIGASYSLNLETMTIWHSECVEACFMQKITLKDNKTEFLNALKIMQEKTWEGLKTAPKGVTKEKLKITSKILERVIRKIEKAQSPITVKPIVPEPKPAQAHRLERRNPFDKCSEASKWAGEC